MNVNEWNVLTHSASVEKEKQIRHQIKNCERNRKMSENMNLNGKDDTPEKEGVVDKVIKIFENGWNKQVILYGPPGTSKTYSATIIAAKFLAGSNWDENKSDENNTYKIAKELLENEYKANYKIVQFHPSYSYEDFVRGITVKPAEENNGITYVTESKFFESFCKQAQNNKEQKYVLIIDEINRAPLASVLGELIYGLEYRESSIATPYAINGEYDFSIPDNLYIIGTMNTADRSIGSIDYAVRRRFAFVQVESNGEEIKGSWIDGNAGEKAKNLYDELMNEKEGIFSKNYLEDQDMDVNDIKIGHTYFLGRKNEQEGNSNVKDGMEYLKYRIEYQIKPIYEEYIKDGIIKSDGLKKFDEILEKLELK